MASLFTRIINGELPSYKIAENDRFFAFLDINPLQEGHVLVVPRLEVDQFFDLPDELLRDWFGFAKPIAAAIRSSFPCNRCGITVMGLEVPHAHMHLIPINTLEDMNFARPKLKLSPEQLAAIRDRIIQNLHW